MAAPNKEERAVCWDSRDTYWKCLDENDGDKTKCLKVRKTFEDSCTKSWVKYFDRRKDYLRYKDKIEKDGFDPVENKAS